MEAKDTVKQTQWPLTYEEYLKFTQSQAEVSFKAGIKEVIRWLGGEHVIISPDKYSLTQFTPYYIVPMDELKAKLKEWDID